MSDQGEDPFAWINQPPAVKPRENNSNEFLRGPRAPVSQTPSPAPAAIQQATDASQAAASETTILIAVPMDAPTQEVAPQPAPPPGQETQAALEELRSRSSKHIAAEQLRLRLQTEVEGVVTRLWQMLPETGEARGRCACGNPVVRRWEGVRAVYDDEMLPAVEKAQNVLQSFLARVTLPSLFDESTAEQALTCHIHALLVQTASTLEQATDPLTWHRVVATLVSSLEVLFGALLSQQQQLTAHATAVVRSGVLALGTRLLKIVGVMRQQNTGAGVVPDVEAYLMGRVVEIAGCEWARCLLQPLVSFSSPGLPDTAAIKVLVNETEQYLRTYLPLTAAADPSQPATRLTEPQYTNLLLQFPWKKVFARLGELSRQTAPPAWGTWVHQILFVIVERIEAAESKRFYLLLLHLSNVLIALACEARENATLGALEALTASSRVVTLISSPLLLHMPWDSLSPDLLFSAFARIYGLPPASVDGVAEWLNRDGATEKRDAEREALLHSIAQNHQLFLQLSAATGAPYPLSYRTATAAGQLGAHPLLQVLEAIGHHALAAAQSEAAAPHPFVGRFGREIAMELLQIVLRLPPPANSPLSFISSGAALAAGQPPLSFFEYIRIGASKMYQSLVRKHRAELLPQLLRTVGQLRGQFHTSALLSLIEPSLFTDWDVDESSLNWLLYLLTHRTLQADEMQDEMLSPYWQLLSRSAPLRVAPELTSVAVKIVTYGIDWARQSPLIRVKSIAIVLASIDGGVSPSRVLLPNMLTRGSGLNRLFHSKQKLSPAAYTSFMAIQPEVWAQRVRPSPEHNPRDIAECLLAAQRLVDLAHHPLKVPTWARLVDTASAPASALLALSYVISVLTEKPDFAPLETVGLTPLLLSYVKRLAPVQAAFSLRAAPVEPLPVWKARVQPLLQSMYKATAGPAGMAVWQGWGQLLAEGELRREPAVRALLSELVRVAILCHYPLALEALLAGATGAMLSEDTPSKAPAPPVPDANEPDAFYSFLWLKLTERTGVGNPAALLRRWVAKLREQIVPSNPLPPFAVVTIIVMLSGYFELYFKAEGDRLVSEADRNEIRQLLDDLNVRCTSHLPESDLAHQILRSAFLALRSFHKQSIAALGVPDKRTGPELLGDSQLREMLQVLSRPLPVTPHSSAALSGVGIVPSASPAAGPSAAPVADLLGLSSFDSPPVARNAPQPPAPVPAATVPPSPPVAHAATAPAAAQEAPLLPSPLSVDDPNVAADIQRYSTLRNEVQQLVNDLQRDGEPEILRKFLSLCRNFATAVETSRKFDMDYVHLTAMLYRTEDVAKEEPVACASGQSCDGPAKLSWLTHRTVGPLPDATAQLTTNRNERTVHWNTASENMRTIAYLINVIHMASLQLTAEEAQIRLLMNVLVPLCFWPQSPLLPRSPPFAALGGIALRFAPRVLSHGATQMRFLKAILDAYASSGEPSTVFAEPLPAVLVRSQPHYPIDRSSLLALFNPNVFLPSAAPPTSLIDLSDTATCAATQQQAATNASLTEAFVGMFVAIIESPKSCTAVDSDVLLNAFDWKRFVAAAAPAGTHSHAYSLIGREVGRLLSAESGTPLFARSVRRSVCGAVASLCALSPPTLVPALLSLLLKRLREAGSHSISVDERWLEECFSWQHRTVALSAAMPASEEDSFDPRGQFMTPVPRMVLDRCVEQLQHALGGDAPAASGLFLNVLRLMTSLLREHPEQLGRADLLIPLIQRSLEGPLTSLLQTSTGDGDFTTAMASIATGLETVFGLMSGLAMDAAWQLVWAAGSGVVAFLEKLDAKAGRSDEAFEIVYNAVDARLRDLPWSSARLHHTEIGLAGISEILSRSRVAQRLMISLLGVLTWPAESASQVPVVMHALPLLLDLNLLRAAALPQVPLRKQPDQSAESPVSFPLAALVSRGLEQLSAASAVSQDAVDLFSKLFGESKGALMRLVEAGRAVTWIGVETPPADISTELQANARFLVEVVGSALGSQPAALLALVGEVQRCVYNVLLNASQSPLLLWHLPVAGHVALVSAIVKFLSTLSARAAQSKPAVVGQLLQKAFVLMDVRGHWRESIVAEGACLLSNVSRYPVDDTAFLEELELKVHLAFTQVAAALTNPPLIRVFVKHLQLAAWPQSKASAHPTTNCGYLDLLEEFIRAYAACEDVETAAIEASDSEGASVPLASSPPAAFTPSNNTMNALVQILSPGIKGYVTASGKHPLLLYCLLRQQIVSVGPLSPQPAGTARSNEFLQECESAVTLILGATAPAHRAFHMVPLWMLLLHIINDPRLPASGQAFEALLKRIRTHLEKCSTFEKGFAASLFGTSSAAADALAPQVELSARATILYLERILVQKRAKDRREGGGGAKDESAELLAKLDRLLALSKDPRYSRLEEFFSQASTFLSPLCELPTFEQAIAESLFPMAPYLAKVMSK